MNILIVGPVPPLRGGISDFNNELISTINKKHNISILSFSILYPRFFFPGKNQFHNKSANFKKIKTINPYNPFSYLIINKYLKDVNPDVILSTHWNPFFSISYSIINKIVPKRILKIGLLHNINSHENRILDRFFTNIYLNSLNKFVTLSKHTLDQISNKNGISLFHPIPNLKQKLINKNEIIKDLNIKSSKKIFLHFGIVRKYKGLELLIKSFKLAFEKDNNIHLVIVGEFYDNLRNYQELLKKLDLEEHVTIHNKFVAESEIKKWFSIADFVIQTNLNATQSGIISIAIYFEKIIITTAQGGIKEILNDDNSFICEKNSKSISDNILKAIDSDLKEKTKQLKILKKKLNWDSFSKQLLDFIK